MNILKRIIKHLNDGGSSKDVPPAKTNRIPPPTPQPKPLREWYEGYRPRRKY